MLPRAERLTRTDFARVFDNGRAFRSALMQVRAAPRDDETSICRAAFVAGKKLGKATIRNALRRRAREIYRLSAWREDARLGRCDLVFLLAPPALTATREELQRAFDEVLERAAREYNSAKRDKLGARSGIVWRSRKQNAAPQSVRETSSENDVA